MTYYWGLLIGATIGYVFSLITMLIIWSLCVIAKQSDGRDYAEKSIIKRSSVATEEWKWLSIL